MLKAMLFGLVSLSSASFAEKQIDIEPMMLAGMPSQDQVKCRTLEMRANAQCGGAESPELCKAGLDYLKPCANLNTNNPLPNFNEDWSSADPEPDMNTLGQEEEEPVVFERDPMMDDIPSEFRY